MTLRSLIEARIKATVPEFKDVAGAADIRTLMSSAISAPGCYIYRERNTAKPNANINIISQQRTEFIGLIVVSRNVADSRGGINSDESEQLCDLLQAHLLGFIPAAAFTPLEYVSGDLILLRDGMHFWREVYQSSKLLRSV